MYKEVLFFNKQEAIEFMNKVGGSGSANLVLLENIII